MTRFTYEMHGNTKTTLNYGWAILIISTFALAVSNGLSIGGLPVFYKPIREEFAAAGLVAAGTAESFIANGANITFLMSGIFSMLAGWLIARYSIKLLMVIGCLCLGSGLLLHSQANSVSAVYAARFLMGASLGFVGVTPNVVLVSGWFQRNRGTALGILLTGTSFGGVLIPFIAAPLITAYGWRTALAAVSLLVWLVLLPGVLFLVHDPPKLIGPSSSGNEAAKQGFTLRQALRTTRFWVYGLCAALVFYPIFASSQQFILYLQTPKIGLPLETAALSQSSLFAVSVAGKFLAGFLSDKFSATRIMLACCSLMFLATLVLIDLTARNALLFLLPFGLGYGGTFVLLQRLAYEYFGPLEYGKILGTITMIEIIGAAIGGRVTGHLADQAGGDYTYAFYGVIVATGAALVTVIWLNLMASRENK